jgi:DNA-binding MarR family transcriptional regulator
MSESIAFRLMTEIGIIHQLGSTLFERGLPDNLTMPQFAVLNHFARLGGEHSPVELARVMQVTKATMSSTLARLENKGFVTSTPDPKDGRSRRIAISATGRKARERAINSVAHHIADIEREIGVRALEGALPLLTKVRTYLDQRRGET